MACILLCSSVRRNATVGGIRDARTAQAVPIPTEGLVCRAERRRDLSRIRLVGGALAVASAARSVGQRRQRKPITDPVQLERRRAALAKARAARAERLAAGRVAGGGAGGEG